MLNTTTDIRQYLKNCWKETIDMYSLKLSLSWTLLCVDLFCLLAVPGMAQTVSTGNISAANTTLSSVLKFLVWAIGPWNRSLLTMLAFLFTLDLVLGASFAFWEGTFKHRKVFLSLVKGAVYFCIIAVAWQLSTSPELGFLFIGLVSARILEAFLIATEAISVLKNSNKLLEKAGAKLPVLSSFINFMERNMTQKEEDLFGKRTYDITVVDDNPIVRKMMVDFLDNLGVFNVNIHAMLATAIETSIRKKPDCVLLDLHLPDSTGADTFVKYKENCPDVPIIIVTGTSGGITIDNCRIAGAHWILSKQGLKQSDLVSTIITAIKTTKEILEINRKVEMLELNNKLLPDELTETQKGP